MKIRGFKGVYQMDGGVVKYGEKYGDDGFWEGSLYIFDSRMSQRFSEKSKDIAKCIHCGLNTSNYENCANKACNKLVLICNKCFEQDSKQFCSKDCELNYAARQPKSISGI